MNSQLAIPISDPSQIGEARRQMQRLAVAADLDEAVAGKAAIIATELATNIARHSSGGELHLRGVNGDHPGWVEALSVDHGPGMSDVAQCMADGYSTGGTSGSGLGAVRRLADQFDIFSHCPTGTIAVARVGAVAARPPTSGCGTTPEFIWGAVTRPAPNEVVSGDAWEFAEREGEASVLVVDGLGHGPLAAEAAAAACEAFRSDPFAPADVFYRLADVRMNGARGGAVALAHIDVRRGTLSYTGVGNIAGTLLGGPGRTGSSERRTGLVSHNGTVGVQMRKVQTFQYDCPRDGVLVMCSDGLQTRWSLDGYPGLAQRHPAVIAGVLSRDFTRGRDDSTVLVVRFSSAAQV